jgi:hypothetical protein
LLWDLFAGGLRILHEHTWLTRPIYTTSSRTPTNKNHGFWGAEISITQQFPSTFFCLPPQLQDEDEEWRGIFMAPAMLIRESKISHATADPLVMHQDENK